MSNSVIDNTNLINMCRDCGAGSFIPSVAYEFDASAKTVTVTDNSTYNSGAARNLVKIKVHDFFGGTVADKIITAAVDDKVVVDVSSLNLSKQLALAVVVISDDKITADGGAYGLMAAGDVSHWDVQKVA